jgi:hypothetical protein
MIKKTIISSISFTLAGAALGSLIPGIGTLIGGIGGFAMGVNGASLTTGQNQGTLLTGIGIGALLGALVGSLIPIPGVGTLFGLWLGISLGSVIGNILASVILHAAKKRVEPKNCSYSVGTVYVAKKRVESQNFRYSERWSLYNAPSVRPLVLGIPHRSTGFAFKIPRY